MGSCDDMSLLLLDVSELCGAEICFGHYVWP
jgi:hypothetical protein